MVAYLVVQELDEVGRESNARWRVSPLTLTSTFVTAANNLAAATCGASKISGGGIDRQYYEGDIVNSTVAALAGSDVRANWALTSQSTGARPSKQKLHSPILTGNIVAGSFIRGLLSSTAWAAYVTALGAADFGWLDNFGNASPVLLGAVSTVRGVVAPREKTAVTPTPYRGGHLVTHIEDSQGEGANMRIRVTPLTLTSAWETAALALISATYGTGLISSAGYVRAFLEQDILTSPIAAQANTNVRRKWVAKAKSTGHASFQFNIGAPQVGGNLVSGDQVIADLNSTEWAGFLTALLATNLHWISNAGDATPALLGATSNAVARKNPRERVRG